MNMRKERRMTEQNENFISWSNDIVVNPCTR